MTSSARALGSSSRYLHDASGRFGCCSRTCALPGLWCCSNCPEPCFLQVARSGTEEQEQEQDKWGACIQGTRALLFSIAPRDRDDAVGAACKSIISDIQPLGDVHRHPHTRSRCRNISSRASYQPAPSVHVISTLNARNFPRDDTCVAFSASAFTLAGWLFDWLIGWLVGWSWCPTGCAPKPQTV